MSRGISGTSPIPRLVQEVAWACGLGGSRHRIPRRDEASSLVRDLLLRAETRVEAIRDARRIRVRQAWATEREEAARAGVACSTVHEAMERALSEIATWWRGGERQRVESVVSRFGDEGLGLYHLARRKVTDGVFPGAVDPWIVKEALESVRSTWWRQATGSDGLGLVGEAVFLGLLLLDEQSDVRGLTRVACSRLGLPAGMETRFFDEVKRNVDRGVRELKERRRKSA